MIKSSIKRAVAFAIGMFGDTKMGKFIEEQLLLRAMNRITL